MGRDSDGGMAGSHYSQPDARAINSQDGERYVLVGAGAVVVTQGGRLSHSCARNLCDTPHNESISEGAKEWNVEGFKKAWRQREQELCPHGFQRLSGSHFDCHLCVELEKEASNG